MASHAKDNHYLTSKHISGQWNIIIGHTLLVTVPMILVAVIMLIIMIQFSTQLINMEGYSPKSYFFFRDIPTYGLLSLTTLTSILSLLLVPSMLTLSTFLHANDILRMTDAQEFTKLPTTFEFGLLLSVLSVSPTALFRSLGRIIKKPLKEHYVLRRATGWSVGIMILWFVLELIVVPLNWMINREQPHHLSMRYYHSSHNPNN
jgi:hypothetical protein